MKPAAESLDTVGLMARSVEDAELSARVLTNAAPVSWLPEDTRIRIGVCRTYAWDNAEPATRQAIEDAASRLAKTGLSVRDVDLPDGSVRCRTRARSSTITSARADGLGMAEPFGQISDGLAKSIRNGLAMDVSRYVSARQSVDELRRSMKDVFSGVDVLLTPAVNGEAPIVLPIQGIMASRASGPNCARPR